ncbi:hypothetical protein [Nocardia cyriacigeorgica]|uniref:hypothetical protein n=1 Tax=Nocardia cyriacigeorgica TaxID=135487 RepID=UPI0024541BCC|nr:hypothetical protein [Nocardia cyriacigeorgica]
MIDLAGDALDERTRPWSRGREGSSEVPIAGGDDDMRPGRYAFPVPVDQAARAERRPSTSGYPVSGGYFGVDRR